MPRQRKFTENDIKQIRENPGKLSQRELAKVYKCSQQAIWRIQCRKSYKELKDGGKDVR